MAAVVDVCKLSNKYFCVLWCYKNVSWKLLRLYPKLHMRPIVRPYANGLSFNIHIFGWLLAFAYTFINCICKPSCVEIVKLSNQDIAWKLSTNQITYTRLYCHTKEFDLKVNNYLVCYVYKYTLYHIYSAAPNLLIKKTHLTNDKFWFRVQIKLMYLVLDKYACMYSCTACQCNSWQLGVHVDMPSRPGSMCV
jgi:hypothetical protein